MLQISSHRRTNSSEVSSLVAKDSLHGHLPPALGPARNAPRPRVLTGETPARALPSARTQPRPAHLLVVAILQRALDDLQLGGRFRVQAMRWLHEQQSESQPGSFEWCCAALDLDADVVRRKYSTLAFESTATALSRAHL